MGADLLLTWCKVPEDPDTTKARIGQLSSEALEDTAEALWGDATDVDEDFVRLQLTHAVDMLSQDLRTLDRFTCEHGTTYVVTGGMSWGDSPTEAFDQINALLASGLEIT